MIKIRYADLPPGLHVRAEANGRQTVIYLRPGLTHAERRAALVRARRSASMGHGPPLPAGSVAAAVARDRVTATARNGAAAFRAHPLLLLPPVLIVASATLVYVMLSAVSITFPRATPGQPGAARPAPSEARAQAGRGRTSRDQGAPQPPGGGTGAGSGSGPGPGSGSGPGPAGSAPDGGVAGSGSAAASPGPSGPGSSAPGSSAPASAGPGSSPAAAPSASGSSPVPASAPAPPSPSPSPSASLCLKLIVVGVCVS